MSTLARWLLIIRFLSLFVLFSLFLPIDSLGNNAGEHNESVVPIKCIDGQLGSGRLIDFGLTSGRPAGPWHACRLMSPFTCKFKEIMRSSPCKFTHTYARAHTHPHTHTHTPTPTHTHTHAHTKKTSPSARTGGFQSQRGQFTGDQKSRLKITPVLGPKSIFCGSPTASSTGHVGPCAEIRFLALVTHYSRNLSFTMGLGGLKRNVKRPPQTGTKANFSSTHARTSRESTFPFLLTQTFSPNDGERIFHGVSPPRR